jgi:hypothetical protein
LPNTDNYFLQAKDAVNEVEIKELNEDRETQLQELCALHKQQLESQAAEHQV